MLNGQLPYPYLANMVSLSLLYLLSTSDLGTLFLLLALLQIAVALRARQLVVVSFSTFACGDSNPRQTPIRS